MIKNVYDLNDILDFIKNIFPQYSGGNDPYEKIKFYQVDKDVMGFISYSVIYERAELNYIGVEEKYRRKGIAQTLFNSVYDELKNNMVENFSLEVNVNNNAAINFYLKNGFEIKSIRKNYYGDADGYLMVLEVK